MELFNSRRSVVHSTKGIAAATQPLAAAAGVRILEQGGNAAMAAVAMAAAMGVTEPMMTGIGGDVFVLYYNASTKKVEGFNGSGRSSGSLSFDAVRSVAVDGVVPSAHAFNVNVPGAPAAWIDIFERWGNKKLSLREVLEPAIKLASEGFPVSAVSASMWSNGERLLNSTANGKELLVDGKAPSEGDIFVNKRLANVYERLAKHGKAGYYEGPLADAIVEAVQSAGGALTHEDLKSHENLWLDPISAPVDSEVTLHELPPNNHGVVALIALNIINALRKEGKLDLENSAPSSPQYLHALIEALKFAFKDADHYVGDPHAKDIDIKELLSEQFTASRAALFSPSKVNEDYEHGTIDETRVSDTSYFTVTDHEGNACSIIASLFHGFGSGIVPKGSGFALHNRGLNFNLRVGSRNAYGPSKRSYHTIIPGMLTLKNELYATFGVMGGFMQPQGHVQVALNLRQFGLNAQEALDAPRICLSPDPADNTIPTTKSILVYLEDGFPKETVDALKTLGHKVEVVTGNRRGVFGRGQVIAQSKQQGRLAYHAGSDPRGDGAAIPLI